MVWLDRLLAVLLCLACFLMGFALEFGSGIELRHGVIVLLFTTGCIALKQAR